MNAPTPREALAVPSIHVDEIAPSPTNPRKRIDAAYISELASSIKQHGILQPITVRPTPASWGSRDVFPYQIVVGECRWRAAREAGLAEIPAFWRELDDKEVLEIQVVENLQRRDVHPVEEAEGYDQLMKQAGYSADDLAEKVGKSRSYIYGRLKLLALNNEAREAFFSGDLEQSTALLIARVPASLQKKALDNIQSAYGGMSYRTAKDYLQRHFTISLAHATFSLADADLVSAAGSCESCPKRAGNDLVMAAEGVDADVCTDTACFEEKRLARRDQLLANAEKKGLQVFLGDKQREAPSELVSLDDVCEEDGQERTYRQILGDKVPPAAAIVERGYGNYATLHEEVDPTALEKALKKAGWKPAEDRTPNQENAPDPEREAARKEREAKENAEHLERQKREALADAEEGWRDTSIRHLLQRLPSAYDAGDVNPDAAIVLLAAAALRFEVEYSYDMPVDLLQRYGIEFTDEPDSEADLPRVTAEMAKWSPGKALAYLFDSMLEPERRVYAHNYDPARDQPHTMLGLAKVLGEVLPGRPDAAASEVAVALAVGDRVRVTADARGADGKRRKVCGKEGTIEAIAGDHFHVRFGPKRHELVTNLIGEELEKVEQDAEANSTAREPWPFPAEAEAVDG